MSITEHEHKNACRYYWKSGWYSGAIMAASASLVIVVIGWWVS